jgi:hypothetical protein
MKYSYAVVCWIGPGGRCLGDMSQDTYESFITKGLLFGEQRSTMVCFSEYMLGVCDRWLGNEYANLSSPVLLHSFVGIHNPPAATICRNHW